MVRQGRPCRRRSRWRSSRSAGSRSGIELLKLLQDGDRLLAPTQYGAGARSQVNRTWINGYYTSLIGEIERLVDETQTAAKRPSDVVNAGVERLFWASANR